MSSPPRFLPVGKLPLGLLDSLLQGLALKDENVLVGPGIGADACVIRFGGETLLFKTDPITFATENIARYLVTVNANDIACMGGEPRYLLVTLLLPENRTTEERVTSLFADLQAACRETGIALVGGHTEITYGIDRPLAVGFLIGQLNHTEVIRTSGAHPGDSILLSKGIPLEALSLLAHERGAGLDPQTRHAACNLIVDPGLSVIPEARLALGVGGVTAMHDPTEGGLATGLRELAHASGCGLEIVFEHIPILPLATEVLTPFGIDPLGAIASGALLVCCAKEYAAAILEAWRACGIPGKSIGRLTSRPDLALVKAGKSLPLPAFEVDEIARVFARHST